MKLQKVIAAVLSVLMLTSGLSLHSAAIEAENIHASESSSENVYQDYFSAIANEHGTLLEEGSCEGSGDTLLDGITYSLYDSGNLYVTKNQNWRTGLMKEMDVNPLQNPDKVKHVYIGPSISWVVKGLFNGLSSIESIVIESGTTVIGPNTFQKCTGVTYVKLPDTLDIINPYAFAGCTSLEEINLPEGLSWMDGGGSFAGCTSLKKITFPSTLTVTGAWAFENCTSLTEVNLHDGMEEISSCCFEGCISLESIEIPDSVTKIGSYAFDDCSSLKSITIPKHVVELDNYTFKKCSSLTEVNLPENLTSIKGGVFEGCTSLESIAIPDNVSSLGRSVFDDCTNLKTVHLPSEITVLPQCFRNCASLESIVIPEGVVELSYGAFNHYYNDKPSALKSISLPSTLKTIGNSCFNENWSLESVVIPASVENLGEIAFDTCRSLKSVTFEGNNITEIPTRCFCLCRSLEEVDIPEGVTIIGTSAFASCSTLSSVTIPDSVTEIGTKAFNTCYSLSTVNFEGNNVTTIGEMAFSNCFSDFKTIVLPPSITSVGNGAFSSCNNLKVIIFTGDKPEFGTGIVSGSSKAVIYYPADNPTWQNIQEELGADVKCKPIESGLIDEYAVSYDMNGGNGSIPNQTKMKGLALTLSDAEPKKSGYEFVGWSTDKNAAKPEYQSGDKYTENADMTLYAIWVPQIVNTSTASSLTAIAGSSITINGSAKEGTGNYKYEFYYKKQGASSWSTFASNCRTDTTATLKSTSAGTFIVRTYAKDGKTAAVKDFTITFTSSLSNQTTVTSTTPTVGTAVTINGAASGGTGSYKYEFYYKKQGASSWSTFSANDRTDTTATLNVSSEGSYDVRVYVKDNSGKADVKNFVITYSK